MLRHVSAGFTFLVWISFAGVSDALAQSYWWQNPKLKYAEEMVAEAHGTSPHYWKFGGPSTTDSTLDQTYLYTQDSNLNENFSQYVVAELRAANSADEVEQRWFTFHIGGRPKGCSQFGNRLIVGNGGEVDFPFTSYPDDFTLGSGVEEILLADRTPDCDTLSFNHDGTLLYTDHYATASGSQNWLHRFRVTGPLDAGGTPFTRDTAWGENGTFTTSLARLRNFSVHYINGKDLIYYGEGGSGVPTSVFVLDPDTLTETRLVEWVWEPGEVQDPNIVNIKVAGIASGDMHLYVMGNIAGLKIYQLSSDGLHVENNGEPVRVLYIDDLNALCNTTAFSSHSRAFLTTDDQQYAFFSAHNANANIFVMYADPAAALKDWKLQ